MSMVLESLQSAHLVPVPTLPPRPASPDVTALGWVLMSVVVACTLGFATIVVRSELGFRRKNELIVLAWFTLGIFLSLGATIAEQHLHQERQDAARDAYWTQRDAAHDEVRRALETTYGIELVDSIGMMPMEASEFWDPVEVRHADGSPGTCWFKVVQAHYSVRCGPAEETATTLTPLTHDTSSSAGMDSASR